MVTTIALIGLGPGAEPHAKSLHDLAGRVAVKAAAPRTQLRAQAFADRFGFPDTTDIDAVIADPAIQAVIVLTPPAAHQGHRRTLPARRQARFG
jgi:predicted dehydrogenase